MNQNQLKPPPGFSVLPANGQPDPAQAEPAAVPVSATPSNPAAPSQAPVLKRQAPPPGFHVLAPEDSTAAAPPPPEGYSVLDPIKEVGAGALEGTGSLISGVGSLAQLAARPIVAGVNAVAGHEVLDAPANPLQWAGSALTRAGHAVSATETPAAQKANQATLVRGDILHPSTLHLGAGASSPAAWLQSGANMVGQLLPMLAGGIEVKGAELPSELAAKIAAKETLSDAEKEVVAGALRKASRKTLTRGAVIGGTQWAQGTADAEHQRIMQLTPKQLAKIPGYQSRIAKGMSPAAAQADLASTSAQDAFAAALPESIGAGLIGAAPFLHGAQAALAEKAGKSVLKRALAGAAIEAPLQGGISVAQQAAGTAGANAATGENRSLTEGSVAAFGGGAFAGGAFSAAGAAFHRGESPALKRYPDAEPGSVSDAANAVPEEAAAAPAAADKPVVRAQDIMLGSKRRLKRLKGLKGRTADEQAELDALEKNIDNPQALADMHGVSLAPEPKASESTPKPVKSANKVQPLAAPWVDTSTGAIEKPHPEQVTRLLAHQFEAQYRADNTMRVDVGSLASAWGIPADQIKKVRGEAQALATGAIKKGKPIPPATRTPDEANTDLERQSQAAKQRADQADARAQDIQDGLSATRTKLGQVRERLQGKEQGTENAVTPAAEPKGAATDETTIAATEENPRKLKTSDDVDQAIKDGFTKLESKQAGDKLRYQLVDQDGRRAVVSAAQYHHAQESIDALTNGNERASGASDAQEQPGNQPAAVPADAAVPESDRKGAVRAVSEPAASGVREGVSDAAGATNAEPALTGNEKPPPSEPAKKQNKTPPEGGVSVSEAGAEGASAPVEAQGTKRINPKDAVNEVQDAADAERIARAKLAIANGKEVSVQDARDAGVTEAPEGYMERFGRYEPKKSDKSATETPLEPPSVTAKREKAKPEKEVAKTNTSETPNSSFRIEAKGPKGLVVHGDRNAIRDTLQKSGFRKKGYPLKAGGLRFDAKDRATIEKALNPSKNTTDQTVGVQTKSIADMPLKEFLKAGREAFVTQKGKRRLSFQWGHSVHSITDQRNGKLTKPVDEVLREIHHKQVEAAVQNLHNARTDLVNKKLGAGMKALALKTVDHGLPAALSDHPDLVAKAKANEDMRTRLQQSNEPRDDLAAKKKEKAQPGKTTRKPIEDFGQKLEGARKDQPRSLATDLADKDIAAQPLSKIWPAKELDDIKDPFAAAVAHAARDEIPAKPRKSYKVSRWVEKVKHVRELARFAVEGRLNKEMLHKRGLDNFAAKVDLLQKIDRSAWKRIGNVREHPDSYRVKPKEGGGFTNIPSPHVAVEIDGKVHRFNDVKSVDAVTDKIKAILGNEPAGKKMRFEVRRSSKDRFFINKKGDTQYRHLKEFTTKEDAFAYRDEQHAALVQAWEDVKKRDNVTKSDMRRSNNRDRTGPDYRNGEDVTPERFSDSFGFRGVEFGNWVKQGKNGKERQGLLNQAYDSLMDLADIVGVPPRAMSLNGTLGLGLGSRGHGWASAHFEASRLVINLTKTRGAGALAHEWFHALDNYFARLRTDPVFKGNNDQFRREAYVTYRPEPVMVNKEFPRHQMTAKALRLAHEQHPEARLYKPSAWEPDPNHPDGVRPVVEKAFAELVQTLDASPMTKRALVIDKGKSEGYWSQIIERAARSFENYVIVKMADKGIENDYLANVTTPAEFKRANDRYPYLKPDEVGPVAEAFDNLFNTIETRKTENGNVALFQRSTRPGARNRLGVKQVKELTRGILRMDPDKSKIEVIPSFAALPDGVHRAVVAQGVHDGDINALHWRGKSWILADMMRDPAHVAETIFHEHYTHGGLRAKFGRELGPQLDKLLQGMGGLDSVRKMATKQNVDLSQYERVLADNPNMTNANRQRVLMEELLAHMSKLTGTLQRGVQEWLGAVRAFMRRHGFAKLSTYDASDLAHVLRQAREAIQARDANRSGDVPMFQRVWHGTPHSDIEKEGFKLQHIGTGEGSYNYVIWDEKHLNKDVTPYFRLGQHESSAPKDTKQARARHQHVEKLVKTETAKWGDEQPDVEVYDSPEQLPPEAKADPRYRRAEGYYDGKTVYLITPNLHTDARVRQVLAHEAVGHYGVDRIVDDALGAGAWDKVTDSVATMRTKVRDLVEANRKAGKDDNEGLTPIHKAVAEAERRYGQDDPTTFAKETLAIMAEHGIRNSIMDRVVRAVRAFVRRVMPSLKASPAELRQLLVRSDKFLRTSESYAQRVARVHAMSFARADPVDSPAFKRYFKGSEVTTGNGTPMLVYHGTSEGFHTFDDAKLGESTGHMTAPLGHFFAEDRAKAARYAENASGGVPADERVIDAYLAIKHPKNMTVDQMMAIDSQAEARALKVKLQAQGYDGIHLSDVGQWVAFKSSQVKSASENRGTFDGSNPDIRFSMPDVKRSGREAKIDADPEVFDWLGVKPNSIYADVPYLRSKHPNLFPTDQAVVDHLSTILKDPEYAIPATKDGYTLLAAPAQEGGRKVAIIELVRRGGKYRVRSAHVVSEDQLQRKIAATERAGKVVRRRADRELGVPGAKGLDESRIASRNPTSSSDEVTAAHDESIAPKDDADNDGAKGSFSVPEANIDTMDKVLAQPDESAFQRAKGWLAGKWEDIKPSTLGALQLRNVLELAEEHPALKGAKQYADLNQLMDADRNQLLVGSPDAAERPKDMLLKGVAPIVEEWRKWAFQKGLKGMRGGLTQEAKNLNSLMHDATIMGLDPSEKYTRLHMANSREEFSEWTPEAVKDRIKAIRDQMRGRPGDDKTMMMEEVKRLRGLAGREKMRQRNWPDLVARWNALPESAQKTYRQVRDWYREHADATENALLSRIDAMDVPETYRRSLKDRIRFQFESNRREGVYFPLDRNGDYWLSVSDKNGEQGFKMFESARELQQAERKLRASGFTIEASGRRDGDFKAKQAPDGTFVKDVIELLKKARASEKVQDEVYQMFLKSLPEMSMRKRHIHRRAVPGFSEDALRSFAKNGFHGSHQLARLRYSQQMQAVLEAMQMSLDNYRQSDEMGKSAKAEGLSAAKGDALLGELKRRHEWIMNPKDSKLANMATSVGFMYYLGASPASALVNLTQGAQVTLPVLAAEHGWPKATRMLASTTKDALRTGGNIQRVLNAEEQRAYRVLEKRGDIDRTNAHTLAGTAEGNVLTTSPAWSKTMNVMSWMFHKAEIVNREAAGIAAYRLARSKGKSFDEAVKYASDIINGTHFDYSAANRPRFMQNGAAKVLLQFKNYSVGMTWLLYRNLYQAIKGESPEVRRIARRTFTGMMGMTALMAGSVGLPIFNLMKMSANAAHAVAGDKDEPWDFETEYRSWLAEHFGQTGANLIADGAVDQLGLHISNRVSMSNLWFRDADQQLEGRDAYYNLLDSVAGPLGGMVKNWYVGNQEVSQGHVWRGVERMMPTFAKNGMKAVRYATQGVNTLRGDPIIADPSTSDALFQALGFYPTQVANQSRINNALYNYSHQIQNRRQTLMNAFAMAIHHQDQDARRSVLKQIRHFNSKFPDVGIGTKNLMQSLRARARASQRAENGVILNHRVARRAREEIGAMATPPQS